MKRARRMGPVGAVVPTASMADIAFLLIIFFMLTTSFSPERTNVELPQSEIRTEVPKDAAIVAITADGTILFTDGERPSETLRAVTELGLRAKEILEFLPNQEFLIKADRAVQYRVIDSVLDQLRLNGARRIGLLTERETGRATG